MLKKIIHMEIKRIDFRGFGGLKAGREELKTQIEKMKCCENCKIIFLKT